jgi:uncharacterized membrane protein YecN with MAPEG domain
MDLTVSAQAAALWTGVHLLLLLVLSVLVFRQRREHQTPIGEGEAPSLGQAVRAFRGAALYAPAGLIGLAVLALAGAAPAVIHVMGVTLFAGRVVEAVALSRGSEASMLRSTGVVLTWLSWLAVAVALIFYAIP